MSSWSTIRIPKNWCVYSDLYPLGQELASEESEESEETVDSNTEESVESNNENEGGDQLNTTTQDSEVPTKEELESLVPPIVLDDTITLEYWDLQCDEFAVSDCEPEHIIAGDDRLYYKHQITLKPKQCTKSTQMKNGWVFSHRTNKTVKGKSLLFLLSYGNILCREKRNPVSSIDFVNTILL